MTREPRDVAERHMCLVWFLRAVAWATGYDEDYVALIANAEAHLVDAALELDAMRAWDRWKDGAS